MDTDAIALLDSLYVSGDLSVDQHAGIMRGFQACEHARADLSRQIGEQHTTIGYQDAMLARLSGAAIILLVQLAAAQGDDESYLWRPGGRPLDEAYKALGRAVERTKGNDP